MFFWSYPIFMTLKYQKYVAWVRSISVIPKRNKGTMTNCYVWVRLMPYVLKYNHGSSIHCYLRTQKMSIVPKLHVYLSFIWNHAEQVVKLLLQNSTQSNITSFSVLFIFCVFSIKRSFFFCLILILSMLKISAASMISCEK